MRILLIAPTLFFSFLLIAQSDSIVQPQPISYEGVVHLSLSEKDAFDRMLTGFKRSFGKHSGTSIVQHSAEKDSLKATSKINFVQKGLQSKEDVRGVITFEIVMHADATQVQYSIANFFHRGNPQFRYTPKNFGLLTDAGTSPKVAGISFKNRQQIWQEMKDTVDVHIRARIANFEAQMKLDL